MSGQDATFPAMLTRDIEQERKRALRRGYDADHDDANHDDGAIAAAAAFLAWPDEYTDGACDADECLIPHPAWAYELLVKHQHDRRRQLVIAMGLLWSEIERLDRAAKKG